MLVVIFCLSAGLVSGQLHIKIDPASERDCCDDIQSRDLSCFFQPEELGYSE